MNCPSCNSTDAYVGFATVECVNTTCKHFKAAESVTVTVTLAMTGGDPVIDFHRLKGTKLGVLPWRIPTKILSFKTDIADETLAELKRHFAKAVSKAEALYWKPITIAPSMKEIVDFEESAYDAMVREFLPKKKTQDDYRREAINSLAKSCGRHLVHHVPDMLVVTNALIGGSPDIQMEIMTPLPSLYSDDDMSIDTKHSRIQVSCRAYRAHLNGAYHYYFIDTKIPNWDELVRAGVV